MYNEPNLDVYPWCVFGAVFQGTKLYHYPYSSSSSSPPITFTSLYCFFIYTGVETILGAPLSSLSSICWSQRLIVACCLLLRVIFTYQGERELGQCDPYRNASLSLFFLLSCIFIYTTQHTRLWHDFTHYISSHSLLCLDFILLYRLRNIIQSISSSDQLVSPNWHRLGTSVGPSGRSATALSSRSRVYRVKGNGETLTVIFVYVPQCQHIGVRQYRVAQGSMHVCAVSMSWLQWFILALLLLH